jgi:malate permease and related proteins
MSFLTVFNQVLIIFIIIVVGFICRKLRIIEPEMNKSLSSLIINITMPCAIITSFNQELPTGALFEAGKMFVLAMSIYLFSIFLGMLLFHKYEIGTKKIMWFTTVFSNCGFMGLPVLESVFGKMGLFYGAVYVVVCSLFTWSFGQILFSGERDMQAIRNSLLNPCNVAVYIGILMLIFLIKLPFAVTKVIDMIGSVTTPLAMIVIGSALAEVEFKAIFSDVKLYYGNLIRLVILPVLTFVVLKNIGVTGYLLGVSSLTTAMPAAANMVMLAEKFDGDAGLASRMVFLSTVLSVITIPLVTLLL